MNGKRDIAQIFFHFFMYKLLCLRLQAVHHILHTPRVFKCVKLLSH